MDHYADDLAEMIEALDLYNIILVGFSTGGGEVARYVGRHGTGRIAKLGLISAVRRPRSSSACCWWWPRSTLARETGALLVCESVDPFSITSAATENWQHS